MARRLKASAKGSAKPENAASRKGGRPRINTIYKTVRDRICFFEYPPATVIKEVVLAEEFGVSRTPIRQILQRLEAERLVEIRDGVGTIVTGIDFKRLRDVYELRLRISDVTADFLQKAAIAKAAEEIDVLIRRCQDLQQTHDIRTFWLVENDRHQLLNGLIANEPLRELHDSLYMQTARVWYEIVESVWPEAINSVLAELSELQRALTLGDPRAIASTSRNNIVYSMSRLSQHFGPS